MRLNKQQPWSWNYQVERRTVTALEVSDTLQDAHGCGLRWFYSLGHSTGQKRNTELGLSQGELFSLWHSRSQKRGDQLKGDKQGGLEPTWRLTGQSPVFRLLPAALRERRTPQQAACSCSAREEFFQKRAAAPQSKEATSHFPSDKSRRRTGK